MHQSATLATHVLAAHLPNPTHHCNFSKMALSLHHFATKWNTIVKAPEQMIPTQIKATIHSFRVPGTIQFRLRDLLVLLALVDDTLATAIGRVVYLACVRADFHQCRPREDLSEPRFACARAASYCGQRRVTSSTVQLEMVPVSTLGHRSISAGNGWCEW